MSAASKEEIETHWLRTIVLPEILQEGKLIENYDAIKKANTFKVHNIDINFIGHKEAFMLTICYRAAIEFEYDGVARTLKLVVKKTPQIPDELYEQISFTELFSNEVNTYTHIIPALEEFTNSTLNFTKFFYSELQPGFATVVVEDFGVHGWQVCEDRYNLSLEHIMIAVKYLGNFHGIGFALKHLNRSKFEAIRNLLLESRFARRYENVRYALSVKTGIERCITKTEQYHPEVPVEFLEKFKSLLNDSFDYSRQLITESKEELVTLCHGDFLRNNVAFKYNVDDKATPTDVLMFDLQTMRISSPMSDLALFLCLSSFAEVRYKHFDEIFSCYCEALATAFEKYAKTELPTFLSQENLLLDFIRFMPYGSLIASSFLMVLIEPEDILIEEIMTYEQPAEDTIREALTRGGDIFDRELSHQLKEIYELSTKYDVNICEGINLL